MTPTDPEARFIKRLERRAASMAGTFTEAASLYDLALIEHDSGTSGGGESAERRLMTLLANLYHERDELRAQIETITKESQP